MNRKAKQARNQRATGTWRRIIDEYIAKALGNAFRQQILWILNERIASPSEIAVELGEDLRKVCNHINVLKEAGCIELVYVRAVGNRLQSFYRANARAFLDGLDWPSVPDSVKVGMRATLLRNILEDSIEAVVDETYDRFDGSHMSWTPMILDEQGRGEIAEIFERALLDSLNVADGSKARLLKKNDAGHSYTVSILAYPSSGGCKSVGPPVDAASLQSEVQVATPGEDRAGRSTGARPKKPAKGSRARKGAKTAKKSSGRKRKGKRSTD